MEAGADSNSKLDRSCYVIMMSGDGGAEENRVSAPANCLDKHWTLVVGMMVYRSQLAFSIK